MSRVPTADRRSTSAGFTLIEALVALAFLATTLASVGALVASTVRGTRSLEQHLALIESARAIVTGLPNRRELALGNLAGVYGDHNWRVDVVPFIERAADPSRSRRWVPQEIVIQVRSPSGSSIKINTVRLVRRGEG